jgi:2-polyprenyl-3-methyl-5-hydroxy-6-metoxy-1,4-benzoquinol methylase
MSQPFDAKSYWESRLQQRFDLRGVGDIGLPESYNRLLYRVRRHAFRRVLRALPLQAGRFDALDIGSGTGFYVEQLLRKGPRTLTASDLTEAAVDQLSGRYSTAKFVRCDIGGPLPPALIDRQFDIVSAMDMLFHIVDDERYETAFANFAALVKPSGWLIFSDNLMRTRKGTVPHQVSRAEREVRDVLRRSGFGIERIVPMFVLMNDPVRSDSRVLRKAFSMLYRVAAKGETMGRLAGGIVYPFERAAIATFSRGPSTEIVVCRRLGEAR